METHNRLQNWLRAASVSPGDLAKRCGYDRSNFNKVLKGTIRPSLDLAVRIERETNGTIPVEAWAREAA